MSVARSAVRRMATVQPPLAATSPMPRRRERSLTSSRRFSSSPSTFSKESRSRFWQKNRNKVLGVTATVGTCSALFAGFHGIAKWTVTNMEKRSQAGFEQRIETEKSERVKFEHMAKGVHEDFVRKAIDSQASMQAQLLELKAKLLELEEMELQYRKMLAMADGVLTKLQMSTGADESGSK